MLDGLEPLSRFDKAKIDPEKALRYARLFDNMKLVGAVKTLLRP